MISVYLQPDITQIVRGRLRKNNVLEIQYKGEIPQSYLSVLESLSKAVNRQDIITELARLFYDIKEMTNVKGEEIYFVLPDYLFSIIDCFQYETDEDIRKHISGNTSRPIDNFYYAAPIITKPEPQQKLVTVCAIERELIDCFIQAAEMEHVRLFSIEPASMSFLRCSCEFSKEEFVLHSFGKHATLIGYSSIAGMFKLDAPELSMENLGSMEPKAAEAVIQSTLIEFENIGLATFDFMNKGIPLLQLTSPLLTESFAGLRDRKAERKVFPDIIEIGSHVDMDEAEQQEWMCAVGTLLQGVDFSYDQFRNVIDEYETIQSGNILPENIQKSTRSYQFMQKLLHGSRIAVAVLFVTIMIESIFILFLSTVSIPQSLQDDYDSGQKTIQAMNHELDIIQLEKKEHEYPLEAFYGAVEKRPNNLSFVTFEVGAENKNKDSDQKWVKLKVVAADPLVFQDYVSGLSSNDIFSGIAVTQIGSDSSGFKTADIVIGKGRNQ